MFIALLTLIATLSYIAFLLGWSGKEILFFFKNYIKTFVRKSLYNFFNEINILQQAGYSYVQFLLLKKTFINYLRKNKDSSAATLLFNTFIAWVNISYQNMQKELIDLHNLWLWWAGSEVDEKFQEWLETQDMLHIFSKKKSFNVYKYRYYAMRYKNWRNFYLSPASFYYYQKASFKENFFRKIFTKNSFLTFNTTARIHYNELISFRYLYITISNIFYNFTKTIIVAFFLGGVFFVYCLNYFAVNITRQLGIWFVAGVLFMWLMSGFNFFLKRYQFAKFTSVIARFWKRTSTYFWISEGFLFSIFLYYYLNSSQEPVYMYDFNSLIQIYLPNLYTIYLNTWLLLFIMTYFYYWVLNISNFTIQQNIAHLIVIILGVLYIYLIESYQFYYLLNYFTESSWIYLNDTNIWVLDHEAPKTRARQQYLIFLLIAKYWHFIFIFLGFLFWVLKTFEQARAFYTLTGWNLQNLIILFWLNFVFVFYWFKWIARRYLDGTYFWFFLDSNLNTLKYFVAELFLVLNCHVRHYL